MYQFQFLLRGVFPRQEVNPQARISTIVSLQFNPRDIGTLLIGYTEGAAIYSFKFVGDGLTNSLVTILYARFCSSFSSNNLATSSFDRLTDVCNPNIFSISISSGYKSINDSRLSTLTYPDFFAKIRFMATSQETGLFSSHCSNPSFRLISFLAWAYSAALKEQSPSDIYSFKPT